MLSYPTVLKAVNTMRAAIVAASSEGYGLLGGVVEMDESYFGGRRKGKRGRGAAGKAPVFGILELTFANAADYDAVADGDELELSNLKAGLHSDTITLKNVTKGKEIKLKHGYSPRQVDTLLAGGTLNYTTAKGK